MRRIRTIFIATCLIIFLTACGTQTLLDETEEANKIQYKIISAQAYPYTYYIDEDWANYWLEVFVEIENTGTCNLYLSESTYDLEDAEGNLVSAQNRIYADPQVLQPGEKGYLSIVDFRDSPIVDEAIELTVVPRLKATEATVECIRYDVTDTKLFVDDLGDVQVMGRVENTGTTTEHENCVVAALYDSNHVCVGVRIAYIDDLAPGEKVGFQTLGQSFSDVTIDAIVDTVCYAYPIQIQERE